MSIPQLIISKKKTHTDPLLDLLSAGKPSTSPSRTAVVNTVQAERSKVPELGFAEAHEERHGSKDKVVEPRARRGLLRKGPTKGVAVSKGQAEGGIASLAARAGECAAHGRNIENNIDHDRNVSKHVGKDNVPQSCPPKASAPKTENNAEDCPKSTRRTSKSKASRKSSVSKRDSRPKKEPLGCIVVNGMEVPRVHGVPDTLLKEIALMDPADRPIRCGICGSCNNPLRKKACEVMRSLGANPPIPRGKNRLAILGPENIRKHVSRTCGMSAIQIAQSELQKDNQKSVPSRGGTSPKGDEQEGKQSDWTNEQLQALYQAVIDIPPSASNFWKRVATNVQDRDEAECFAKMYENVPFYTSNSKPKGSSSGKRSRRSAEEKPLDPNALDYISKLIKRRRNKALGHLGIMSQDIDADFSPESKSDKQTPEHADQDQKADESSEWSEEF
jgi:hypothetical protein